MAKQIVFNQDCMIGMKEYPDKYFDLAIVDPPYGIGVGSQIGGGSPFGGKKSGNEHTNRKPVEAKVYRAFDDSSIPSAEYFEELKRVSKSQIIWGGNYFLDYLGATPCVIVWDKNRMGLNFADCEIAWTSFKEPSRIFEFKWNGMLQGDMKNKEERIHPTQKPVALYEWLLKHYAQEGYKILDTHVGSGSSRIACYNLDYDFIGYEIDEYYFKAQEHRFEVATQQMRLF